MKSSSKIRNFAALAALLVINFSLFSFVVLKPGWDVPEKYKKMVNPVKPEKESIAAGKDLFTKNCKACHGVTGAGNGKMAGGANFTSKEFKAQTDGDIFYKITEGKEKMPSYKNKIKEDNSRWNLVNYMRTL
jgi:mono/diheme cytochrome c family protein